MFYQVQLHPGLVTDSCAYERSKAKWGAMEPSEIATHSIHFCKDYLLTSLSPAGGEGDRTGEGGREGGREGRKGEREMRKQVQKTLSHRFIFIPQHSHSNDQ